MVASDVWDRLKRSNRLAEKRIDRAVAALDDDVVDRLMIFALHLLGGPAGRIGAAVDKPVDSVNGIIQRVYKEGLPALEDRRQRASTFRPVVPCEALPEPVRLSVAPDLVCVDSCGVRLERELSALENRDAVGNAEATLDRMRRQ